jgi:putative Mn2+ efflux pump MntP
MPEHELATLMTLNIGMTLSGLLISVIGVWAIMRELRQSSREITQMTREVAFMIRRQYGDIDRDLQEIKELLGGR